MPLPPAPCTYLLVPSPPRPPRILSSIAWTTRCWRSQRWSSPPPAPTPCWPWTPTRPPHAAPSTGKGWGHRGQAGPTAIGLPRQGCRKAVDQPHHAGSQNQAEWLTQRRAPATRPAGRGCTGWSSTSPPTTWRAGRRQCRWEGQAGQPDTAMVQGPSSPRCPANRAAPASAVHGPRASQGQAPHPVPAVPPVGARHGAAALQAPGLPGGLGAAGGSGSLRAKVQLGGPHSKRMRS
jgi:hypothetical protein